VAQVIEGLRGERADYKPAERPAQKGDYVKLSYEGTLGGKPIAEIAADRQIYAKVPQTWEEVEGAQDGVLPGLGRQLAGVKTGDRREIAIKFPADFAPVPALAGQTADYAVEIQEIRERVLPPLDDAFFQAHKAADLAGLQAQVKTDLQRQKEHQNRVAQRRQITERLTAMVEFPVPDSLVETETQGVLRQFLEENLRRGVPPEQFEKGKKELYNGARRAAIGRVKLQLILARIAEAEKLAVENEDFQQFLYRESVRTRQKPEKLAKALGTDRDQLRSVQQSILFDKAVDFLVSQAKVATVAPKAATA